MRVQILTNMVAPYRNPFFDAVARVADLDVCFNVLSEPGRNWNVDLDTLQYRYHILGENGIAYKRERSDLEYTESRSLHWGTGVFKEMKLNRPEVIVSLEFGVRSLLALLHGKLYKVPVLLWWEGTEHTEKEVSLLKKLLRKLMVKSFSGYWVNGAESAAYIRKLGGTHNIQEGMTGVDTQRFFNAYENQLSQRETERSQLGLKGVTYLFSGSLSGRKGMREYIAAIRAYAPQLEQSTTFLFVGDGDYREEIESLEQLSNYVNIICTGFVQQEELARYYTVADVVVLPTLDDNWPLATLEACVFGLPQIFSCYNGASADLCASDKDGWVIDPLNTDQFVQALAAGQALEQERVPIERTKELVQYYAPESFAQRALTAFQKAI